MLFVALRALMTAFDFTGVVTGCIRDQDARGAIANDRRRNKTAGPRRAAHEFRDGSLGPQRQRGFRDDECQETFGEQCRRRRTLYFDADFAEHVLLGSSVLLFEFHPAPRGRRAGHRLTSHRLTDLSFSKRVA